MDGIIDLHTHTFLSDGHLLPIELVHRAEAAGYAVIALTDHADACNLAFVLDAAITLRRTTQAYLGIRILAGVELTHVPPGQVERLTREARERGADIVVLHGETINEPVAPGTNRAGIEAGVDVLAHPGLITDDEARLAAERGVFLEISSRPTQGMANGRVAFAARAAGARLVLNSDAHASADLLTRERRRKVALGAGLEESELEALDQNMIRLVQKLSGSPRPV